jgi:hypothetical protein
LPSLISNKKTTILNLGFDFYWIFRSVLFNNDYLGIGPTEKTIAVLTKGNDNPELVSSSINSGILYNIYFKKNYSVLFKSNFSLFSVNARKPYASVEANLKTKEKSNFEFIKDNLKAVSLNDHFEVLAELELSKGISSHFEIQFRYTFSYLRVKYPRKLSAISNVTNICLNYKF